MSQVNPKVIKAISEEAKMKVNKCVSHKSVMNSQLEASHIESQKKRQEKGSTEYYSVDALSSCDVKILTEKAGLNFFSLACKDNCGGINCYISCEADDGFIVTTENLLNQSRQFKINYLTFFD